MGSSSLQLCFKILLDISIKMKVFAVLSGVLAAAMAAPQLPAGLSAAVCPNYPYCFGGPEAAAANPGLAHFQQAVALTQQQERTLQPVLPIGVAGLGAHQAAEAAVLAAQGRNPGTIAHAEEVNRVKQAELELQAYIADQKAKGLL